VFIFFAAHNIKAEFRALRGAFKRGDPRALQLFPLADRDGHKCQDAGGNRAADKIESISIKYTQKQNQMAQVPETPLRIGLVGRVSSGKSSFVNALAGGVISNTSLLRETLRPLYYQFGQGSESEMRRLGDMLDGSRMSDDQRDAIGSMKEEDIASVTRLSDDEHVLPARYGLPPFTLTDLAGIDDADDVEGKFFHVFEALFTQFDLIVYLSDASQAFRDASEVAQFKKIKSIEDTWNQQGNYTELLVIINKYETEDEDDDLEKIFKKVCAAGYIDAKKIYRVSSHQLICDNLARHGLEFYVPNKQVAREFRKILSSTGSRCSEIIVGGTIRLSDEKKDADGKILGDVDGLITYMRGAKADLDNKSDESHHSHNRDVLVKCMGLYESGGYARSPSLEAYSNVMKQYSHSTKPHQIKADRASFAKAAILLMERLERLFEEGKWKSPVRLRLLENALEYECKYFMRGLFGAAPVANQILTFMSEHRERVNLEALVVAVIYGKACGGNLLKQVITYVLQHKEVYENKFDAIFWSVLGKRVYPTIPLYLRTPRPQPEFAEIVGYSWYISTLMNINYKNSGSGDNSYWQVLVLSQFTVPEMVSLVESGDIEFIKDHEMFPMIYRSIKWITSRALVSRPISANTIQYAHWSELLKPYWDGDHKAFELKKTKMLADIEELELRADE
jgi:predicted GTPase